MSGLLRRPIKDIKEDDFESMTVGGVLWRALVFGLLVLGVLWVVGFVLGWFGAATNVVSPGNVRAQYRLAYTDYESLKATAGNVCGAQQLVNAAQASGSQDVLAQRETQLETYEQVYRRVQADYDAAYDDAFRAKHIGPRDLPHRAPSLDEALNVIGCGP